MKNLVKLILEKFEDEGRNGESERQLDVVVRKEKEFVKGFSREQWKKYNDLEGEKLDYHDLRLEPMTANERRIIHSALTNNPKVETESKGNEPNRYIVIKLVNRQKKSNDSENREHND